MDSAAVIGSLCWLRASGLIAQQQDGYAAAECSCDLPYRSRAELSHEGQSGPTPSLSPKQR